jgi:hypothetical protein
MRIQILELPAVVVGESVTTPFALIFDECPAVDQDSRPAIADLTQRMANLANATGAAGFFATAQSVEIVDRFQDVKVATETVEEKPVELHFTGDPNAISEAIQRRADIHHSL